MNEQHQPNWPEAGRILQEALKEYRLLKSYESFTRVIDDVANSMPGRGWGYQLSTKTVRRDIAGEPIPNHRVESYVSWLHEKAHLTRDLIAEWLEYTAYPHPGELLARTFDAEGDRQKLFNSLRKNGMPSLRGYLWGRFLEREAVIEKAIQWADNRRHPIAVLWGFGGNGKTTIQLKLGEDFVYGRSCPLRWPYEGVVWVSAQDFPRGQPGLFDILRNVVGTFKPVDDPAYLERVPSTWLKQEAQDVLRKRRVLIFLDNFETVSQQNREEILWFFSWLPGATQTLISSRYHFNLGYIAHVLIPVEGLTPEQAAILIQDYLKAHSLPQSAFEPSDLHRLAEVTRNNPKTIITVLGMVEQGLSLPTLLNSIKTGSSEADEVFYETIDKAWQELLTEEDQAVLMAKSFFSQPVSDLALGRVAGVSGKTLSHAVNTLQTISFFDRPQLSDTRIRAHPLAQDFAHRVLRDHPEFEQQAEQRWWSQYAPGIIDQVRRATYTDWRAQPELGSDVVNILEHLEKHLQQPSPYSLQAAELFAGRQRLGNALRQLGWWDEVVRLAEITLTFAIDQRHPRLIGESALKLITDIHRERNELDKAERYVARATEQNVSLGDQWLQATIEAERAQLYRRRGYFKAARQTFQNTLDIFLKLEALPDIATIYSLLGRITVEMAPAENTEAIDLKWKENRYWFEAEEYFRLAEYYWSQVSPDDPTRYFDSVAIRARRGTIARVKGDLDEARQLFTGCIGQFQSLISTAHLYRELALVEHLAGNKDLAYEYEDQGLNLQKQLGIFKNLPPYDCYRIIERMKKEGTW